MLVTTPIVGREAQERAVALVGLGDEEIARAEARVGAERAAILPPTTTVGSSPAARSTVRDERASWWSCRASRRWRRRTSRASARRASRRGR